jgi:alkylhydroperoxidase/carboxymuconolactone decarboxylase family protein YurZ
MRLSILDTGHGFGTKILFTLIRAFSGHPVLDVIKLVKYRPDFYGSPMGLVTQEAMRGASSWSVADREVMAAFIARATGSEWCTKAHAATAKQAYHDDATVSAVLGDVETAPITEALKATLRMLRKLARDGSVSADDLRAVLAAGASREQVEDALAVHFALSVTARLAEAFAFVDPGPEALESGAKYLLARGYR